MVARQVVWYLRASGPVFGYRKRNSKLSLGDIHSSTNAATAVAAFFARVDPVNRAVLAGRQTVDIEFRKSYPVGHAAKCTRAPPIFILDRTVVKKPSSRLRTPHLLLNRNYNNNFYLNRVSHQS